MDGMNFQSVFDNAVADEVNFDTMFGGEEDNDLIGLVLGEAAEESEDFDSLDDGTTPDDLKDYVGGEESDNQPTADSDDSFDIKKNNLGTLGCNKCGVADAVQKNAPDEEDIDGESEKSAAKVDFADESFLDMILGECGDGECPEGDEECQRRCADKEFESPAPEVDVTVNNDGEIEEPAKSLDDELGDEEAIVNDEAGTCKKELKKNLDEELDDESEDDEESEKNLDDELDDDDDDSDDKESEKNSDDDEDSDDSDDEDFDESFIEAVLGESDEEDEEDAIIDDVQDDSELSDAETKALVDDENDIDIIDAVMGN